MNYEHEQPPIHDAHHDTSAERSAQKYWYAIEHIFRIHVEGAGYLEQAKDHLHNGGSILLIPNHESHLDTGVIVSRTDAVLGDMIKDRPWIASSKLFPDFYEKRLSVEEQQTFADEMANHTKLVLAKEAAVMHEVAKMRDLDLIPTVQGELLGTERFRKTNVRLATQALNTFFERLGHAGTVGGFYVEGGRSYDGTLKQATHAVGKRLKRAEELHDRVLLVPLGIVGSRDVYSRDGLSVSHVFSPIHVHVGEPFRIPDAVQDAKVFDIEVSDALLLRVVELLPAWKWGYYAHEQFEPYLNGRSVRFIEE